MIIDPRQPLSEGIGAPVRREYAEELHMSLTQRQETMKKKPRIARILKEIGEI